MRIVPVPVRQDNYAYLLISDKTNAEGKREAFAVDIFDVDKVQSKAAEEGVVITGLLTTHHHQDHSGGNSAFAAQNPGAKIYGGSKLGEKPSLPVALTDQIAIPGNEASHAITLGDDIKIKCLPTPCHTQDSICYHVTDKKEPKQGAVFTGDTLFIGGCGRFFEGTPKEMIASLGKLGELPDETVTYPGHEYTASNFMFAATVEPNNEAIKWGIKLASENEITTGKTTIGDEKKFNVFMRLDNPDVKKATGISEDDSEKVMKQLREMKNKF